jgi:2-methylcitrate dehydratase
MYIFAVALEDGTWHHIKSYTPQRARKKSTINLWRKISTTEKSKWTKKYHNKNPAKRSFGGKVIIKMKNGRVISDEIEVADAHPSGLRPFKRQEYINKFRTLTDGLISKSETDRFLHLVQNLRRLSFRDVMEINPKMIQSKVKNKLANKGIF